MQHIGDWLETLGMSEYAQRFAENDIDIAVLRHLTDQDLKELGVSLGHRRKMLAAISEFAVVTATEPKVIEPEPKPQETAERRQVTVMFSDLVGSTALSARMDPEDLREVISAYQKCVAATVQRFGGFVAKYMGDGVLVYFGYPQAHEDDAERAVRAGLELIQAVGGLRSSTSLQTRLGIATGLVVVGDLIGAGEAQERGIVGETPNLAARLQNYAEPNTVVIAESTRKLLGSLFELQDLGARELKGIGGPVKAWAVVRSASVEGRFEALHATGLTALVGREEELELLLRRWSRAKSGEGQVVLLSGEAGIGKSRLTAALLERIADEPHTRLRYFCSPQHTDSALYPVIGQMERAAGFAHDDTPGARLDKLDAVLAQTSTSIEDAALFADMLSLPNDGRYLALELDPQQRRQRTLEALTSQLAELAGRQPVLMIFEDAHWVDATSLEVFGRTVDRIKALPVMLVVSFRPEFNAPWAGRSYVTSLALNRLGEREAAAIIAHLVGNKELLADVMAEIVERTDGIPLFVEEMTKAVLEAEGEGASEHTVAAMPSPSVAVPASLHASLMARLDRLGSAKEVAQIGAVIGRVFSHAVLAAVVRRPEAELGSAVDRLMAAGLLFRQGVPPHASYLFKHALVQDAAYGTLLREPRRALHARIVETLESQFTDIAENQPELLARHCTEAGRINQAIDYWTKAGQRSLTRSAVMEATLALRKGVALLSDLVESPERQRKELALQTTLGWAEFQSKGEGAPEVGEAIIRARALSDQLGDRSNLGPMLHLYGCHLIAVGRFAAALRCAEDQLNLARERNDLALELQALQIMGRCSHWRGAFASAIEHFEHVLSVSVPELNDFAARSGDGAFPPGADSKTVALSYLAYDLLLSGYRNRAVEYRNQAVALARRTSPYALAIALVWAARVDVLRGARRTAGECLTELATLARQQDFRLFVAMADLGLAAMQPAQGKRVEGLARARQAFADVEATGNTSGVTARLSLLAGRLQRAGEIDEAIELLGKGLDAANATDERCFEAEIHWLKGQCLLAHRRPRAAEAESSYRCALAVARRQEAKFWELRAAASLARLWRDQGKRAEARELLAPVYSWFTEGFETRDLQEAKALLGELGS